MRDLEADKAICDNATRGPWDVMKPIIGRRAWCVVEQKEQGDGYHNLVCRRANTKNSEVDWNNVKFIAAAREGWPHAIERAIKAETNLVDYQRGAVYMTRQIKNLKTEVEDSHRLLTEVIKVIRDLKAENAQLRAALNKLARLGNEPNYGNSDGNMIARQALVDLDEEGE